LENVDIETFGLYQVILTEFDPRTASFG